MGWEIERKFLIRSNEWRQQASEGVYYRQGYLANSDKCSIRVRIAGDKGSLNLKSATFTVTRTEFDYAIPLGDAEAILKYLSSRPHIEKTRYLVKHADHTWEIDVFEGDNKGLIVAEIELTDVDESFERPEWLGEEVSDDPRYYNVCLANHPYKDW
jgi:adenylate cyclase